MGGSGRVAANHAVASTIHIGISERSANGDLVYGGWSHYGFDDADQALEAMRGHDVAIACAGARASEGRDRWTLDLDHDDFLRSLASKVAAARAGNETTVPPLVVAALAPGAFTAEWALNASAVLVGFLTGQETGRAFADVLLGDVNPAAKLPLTIHTDESATATIPPSFAPRIEYTEGLNVGWRGLTHMPVAFPFGHGLSYTRFAYEWARPLPGSVSTAGEEEVVAALHVRVTNIGTVAGSEVAQLYLAYPASAGEPPLVLRGFRKTGTLLPGGSEELAFGLTREGLSTWEERGGGAWRVARGRFVALVGTSSRNTTLSHSFDVVV